MLRFLALLLATCASLAITAAPARADDDAPLVKREAFANAHVLLMARAEAGGRTRLADVELWASGDKLRARVTPERGAPADELWFDALNRDALFLRDGKAVEPRRRSIGQGLQLSLRAAPELGNSKNDRVAGHPCKVLSERLANGMALSRCIWRGLPLSVELRGPGFAFNAAATLVEEDQVSVAELQPPPGAPTAAKGLSATR